METDERSMNGDDGVDLVVHFNEPDQGFHGDRSVTGILAHSTWGMIAGVRICSLSQFEHAPFSVVMLGSPLAW